jgi:tetratricopeptide (TPR) repeat protein
MKFIKNNKKLLKFGLVFILALIIIGGGVLAYWQFQKNKVTKPPCEPNTYFSAEKIAEFNKRREDDLKLLKEYPDYYEILIDLGGLENNLGNYQKAIDYYQKAYKVIPANSTPYLNTAEVYRDHCLYDLAYEYYWKAQKVNPKYELIYRKIADFYSMFYKQKINDIEQVYLLGLKETEGQNNINLKQSLAAYYFDNNRFQDSLPLWEELHKADPGNQDYTDQYNLTKQKLGKN